MNTPRAIFYLRLSQSTEESTSIARQRADLQARADAEGWAVVAELVDDGVSGGTARKKVAQALRMLAQNEADVLAVWKLDRFGRRGARDVADLADALDARAGSSFPARFVALQDGLTSDMPMWETFASLYAGQAKQERLNTSLRVKNTRAHLTQVGRFAGGVVPFGYELAAHPSGIGSILTPSAREVAVIHRSARALLGGASVTSIVKALNAEQVPTTRSEYRRALLKGLPLLSGEGELSRGRWTTNGLQLLLTSDHLLGRVIQDGKLLRGEDGLPLQVWPTLLEDPLMLEELRRATRSPRARARELAEARRDADAAGLDRLEQRRRASRLLSGVAYCAHCDSKMYVNSSGAKPVYAYPRRTDPECPAPRMTAEIAERHVSTEFLRVVGNLPEVEVVTEVSDPETTSALAEIELALREATSALIHDESETTALVARIAELKARRAELRALPARSVTFQRPTGRTFAEAWHAERDVEARRRVLRLALDHVTISKTDPGVARKGFHPERVGFVWNYEGEYYSGT